jgi:hypothetical protein
MHATKLHCDLHHAFIHSCPGPRVGWWGAIMSGAEPVIDRSDRDEAGPAGRPPRWSASCMAADRALHKRAVILIHCCSSSQGSGLRQQDALRATVRSPRPPYGGVGIYICTIRRLHRSFAVAVPVLIRSSSSASSLSLQLIRSRAKTGINKRHRRRRTRALHHPPARRTRGRRRPGCMETRPTDSESHDSHPPGTVCPPARPSAAVTDLWTQRNAPCPRARSYVSER